MWNISKQRRNVCWLERDIAAMVTKKDSCATTWNIIFEQAQKNFGVEGMPGTNCELSSHSAHCGAEGLNARKTAVWGHGS